MSADIQQGADPDDRRKPERETIDREHDCGERPRLLAHAPLQRRVPCNARLHRHQHGDDRQHDRDAEVPGSPRQRNDGELRGQELRFAEIR